MVHQLACLGLRDDVVFIDKAAARQTVAVYTLIAEFRYDMDVIPIFDHICFLPKKGTDCHFSGRRSLVFIVFLFDSTERRMFFFYTAYPSIPSFSTSFY